MIRRKIFLGKAGNKGQWTDLATWNKVAPKMKGYNKTYTAKLVKLKSGNYRAYFKKKK